MTRFSTNRPLLCAALAVIAALAVVAVHAAPAPSSPSKTPLKGIVPWMDEARDHPELRDVVALEGGGVIPLWDHPGQ